ncbi:MAG: TIGR02270 family protein, partial [Thiohalomonadales bacterium]
MIIENIVTQHAEESAFLWLLRDAAVRQPHYDLNDLVSLDNRVEAHIDGLRISGDEGWSVCKEVLAIQEPGETFASAVLAFECLNGGRMDSVITTGCGSRENYRGLLSALGWIPFIKIESCLQGMLSANSPDYRRLALAAYAIHREDPGLVLTEAVDDTSSMFHARALRAIGELKRIDLLPSLLVCLQAEDAEIRFWAAWSALLLGDRTAIEVMKPYVLAQSAYSEAAMQIMLRFMDVPTSTQWLSQNTDSPAVLRLSIIGAGIIGDPLYIPWLIKMMASPELARVAGEAFS